MFWTEETLAFLRDAARYSRYYTIIAEKIAPHLPMRAHLCDAGCGTGGLSLALLPYCETITAIDKDARAIGELSRTLPCAGLTARCADIATHTPEIPYDAMVFCLFGSIEETLRIAARQCRGEIFLVKRDYDRHRFSAGSVSLGEYNAPSTAQVLTRRGIPYECERFTADFGQPFRSLDEAERFFALYNRSPDASLTREEIAARLTAGPDAEFPYYLPNEKKLCLFRLRTQDITEDR